MNTPAKLNLSIASKCFGKTHTCLSILFSPKLGGNKKKRNRVMGYYIYHKKGRSREEEEGHPNKAVTDKKNQSQKACRCKTDSPSRQNVSKSKIFRNASRSLRVYDGCSPLPLDVCIMA
jgi:hypothetical protein